MDKNVLELSNDVGKFIQYWGFKEIHGKVWTLIYLSPEKISARTLKDTLGISKALLSTTISDLKEYNLINECGSGKNGTQLFQAHDNLLEAITGVLKSRERVLITNVKKSIKNIKPSDLVDAKRLKKLKSMINLSSKTLNAVIRWEHLSLREWKIFG